MPWATAAAPRAPCPSAGACGADEDEEELVDDDEELEDEDEEELEDEEEELEDDGEELEDEEELEDDDEELEDDAWPESAPPRSWRTSWTITGWRPSR